MKTREEVLAYEARFFKAKCRRVAMLTDEEWTDLLPRIWRPYAEIAHPGGWLLKPIMTPYPGWPMWGKPGGIEWAIYDVLTGEDTPEKQAAFAAMQRVGEAE